LIEKITKQEKARKFIASKFGKSRNTIKGGKSAIVEKKLTLHDIKRDKLDHEDLKKIKYM